MATSDIVILIHDARFKAHRARARKVIAAGFKAEKLKKATVTVVLTNDKEVRRLNHDFRGKNKATNVLSFPNGGIAAGMRQLGDIVLAYETIHREAKEQGKSFADHLSHLLLHGFLHLLGYDHAQDKDAKHMEKLEIALLSGMGIANPYHRQ